tara:strand:- start:854 stop:991 length:138 start_codon:yes stop_codon:yes gene_type:complete
MSETTRLRDDDQPLWDKMKKDIMKNKSKKKRYSAIEEAMREAGML